MATVVDEFLASVKRSVTVQNRVAISIAYSVW